MATDTSLAFQQLHELLKQLEEAEHILAHGPKRIAASEKKMATAEQACTQQKSVIQQLKKTADEASLNLKSQEAEVAKHATRLNEATSNKEYEIIQGQIDAKKQSGADLEDQILAMLSDVDDANADLEKLNQQLAELQQKAADIKKDVDSREPGLKDDIARLESAVKEAESIVPGGVPMETYKRLKVSQGASGMAKVEDGYCEECNTAVTPQDAIRLNIGEFLLCRACGRILYVANDKTADS